MLPTKIKFKNKYHNIQYRFSLVRFDCFVWRCVTFPFIMGWNFLQSIIFINQRYLLLLPLVTDTPLYFDGLQWQNFPKRGIRISIWRVFSIATSCPFQTVELNTARTETSSHHYLQSRDAMLPRSQTNDDNQHYQEHLPVEVFPIAQTPLLISFLGHSTKQTYLNTPKTM